MARTFSFRKSCAAAGVAYDVAEKWVDDPDFKKAADQAMDAFVELVHEQYVDICFAKGRVPRAKLSALEGFLRANHPVYSRSRMEAALRAHAKLADEVIRILKEHVDENTLKSVQADFDHMATMLDSSGGSSSK